LVNIYSKKLFFSSNIAIYLTLALHKGQPSYRGNLQPSKENIQLQNMTFRIFFLFSWAIFALLDPDVDPANKNQ
jgi:hypothetical protein